jgi:hypothetical protein
MGRDIEFCLAEAKHCEVKQDCEWAYPHVSVNHNTSQKGQRKQQHDSEEKEEDEHDKQKP